MNAFAKLLEREAGQILCCFALILIGVLLYRLGYPKAEDVLPFALGILARSMFGNGKQGADGDAHRPVRAR